jgi:hypothetical protein
MGEATRESTAALPARRQPIAASRMSVAQTFAIFTTVENDPPCARRHTTKDHARVRMIVMRGSHRELT